MKKIKVANIKAGMAFDQPVYIDPTNILVQAQQAISSRDIERLLKWGIREVETNGEIIAEDPKKTATPIISGSMASDKTVTGGMTREEKIRIHNEYENMRKSKIAFRTLIKEAAELLKTNMQMLIEGRSFDNHAILNTATRLVDEINSKNYILLALYGLQLNVSRNIFHSIHAACYGTLLGMGLNYSRPKLQELMFSLLLLDCGMERVPVHIRDKSAALNEAEWTSIKKHPVLGYQLLTKNAKVKAGLAVVSLQHHEAFDGSGYPQSIKTGQIEELARIAAITDSYTALMEKRNHREAMLPYDAMKNLLSVQMNKFDPRLLRIFLGQLSIYPIGSLVELNNKNICLVIGCRSDKPLRPLLRLLRDENGMAYNGLVFMDLAVESDTYIVKALDPAVTGIDLESEI